MSATPPPDQEGPLRLSYRFQRVLLKGENATPPRDVLSAVDEVLGMRSSIDPGAPLVNVYAVDADGIEPDQLLLLLHAPEAQREILADRGLVLFLTRGRHFGDWMPPSFAASSGMKSHLKENEFATQFHEGERANIHIQLVGNRVILVVIFDSKSSLGLVRLRVRKASEELNHIFEMLLKKVQEPGADSPFAEITDEDIDNLFND